MILISPASRICALLGLIACSACVERAAKPVAQAASSLPFYTVTAEIALSRHEPRVAALQYAAATDDNRDESLLRRATQVTADCLQPTLTEEVAGRWMAADPQALDAHRAAARAALQLHQIARSAAQYRMVIQASPRGADAELKELEAEFAAVDNLYGARQVADRLAVYFPTSGPALRLQAFATLRADDPATAARHFETALAASSFSEDERRELTLGLWRAQILAGDADGPLARAKQAMMAAGTAESRLDYAVLLLAAQRNPEARAELNSLAADPAAKPAALRLLGLVDFQDGNFDEASVEFADLSTTGKFLDDSLYYLGLIAERHDDLERAVRLYAQVQRGDNVDAALLRAASILRAHGAAPAAEDLLDRLVEEEPRRAPEILVARAKIYSEAGDVPQAFAVLEQAQTDYPDDVDVRYAAASLSDEQGRVGAALQTLKSVAASRPDDPAAMNAYGYTLADNDRHLRRARALIERAYAAAPKNAAIQDSLGWVLFRQGHGEEALPYLNAAYASEHDGDIAAHLGEVLWRLGRRAEAERIWAEASRANAENRLLKSTRSRLNASG